MKPSREAAPEGGGRSTSVRHVLSSGITYSPPFWGGDLGFSDVMTRKMEGVHGGLLRQITGQKAARREGGTLRQVSAEKVLEKSVIQSLGTYTDRR